MSRGLTAADLGDPTPVETLVYYDGPILYTARDGRGTLRLWYAADRDETGETLFATPIDDAGLDRLEANLDDIRTAILRPGMWSVKLARDGTIAAREIDPADVPDGLVARTGIKVRPK